MNHLRHPAVAPYGPDEIVSQTERATVWSGRCPRRRVSVAIKFIHDRQRGAGGGSHERFEGQCAKLLQREFSVLPKVFEAQLLDDGSGLLVCEWLDGLAVDDWRVDTVETAGVIADLLESLEEMSAHGVSHLNVCPENLLLGLDGRVRLLGLGTPFLVDRVDSQYVAPELPTTLAAAGALWRADLYSTCLVGCELMGLAVEGAGTQMPYVHLPHDMERPMRGMEGLRLILESALHQLPTRRPASFGIVVRALRNSIEKTTGEIQQLGRRQTSSEKVLIFGPSPNGAQSTEPPAEDEVASRLESTETEPADQTNERSDAPVASDAVDATVASDAPEREGSASETPDQRSEVETAVDPSVDSEESPATEPPSALGEEEAVESSESGEEPASERSEGQFASAARPHDAASEREPPNVDPQPVGDSSTEAPQKRRLSRESMAQLASEASNRLEELLFPQPASQARSQQPKSDSSAGSVLGAESPSARESRSQLREQVDDASRAPDAEQDLRVRIGQDSPHDSPPSEADLSISWEDAVASFDLEGEVVASDQEIASRERPIEDGRPLAAGREDVAAPKDAQDEGTDEPAGEDPSQPDEQVSVVGSAPAAEDLLGVAPSELEDAETPETPEPPELPEPLETRVPDEPEERRDPARSVAPDDELGEETDAASSDAPIDTDASIPTQTTGQELPDPAQLLGDTSQEPVALGDDVGQSSPDDLDRGSPSHALEASAGREGEAAPDSEGIADHEQLEPTVASAEDDHEDAAISDPRPSQWGEFEHSIEIPLPTELLPEAERGSDAAAHGVLPSPQAEPSESHSLEDASPVPGASSSSPGSQAELGVEPRSVARAPEETSGDGDEAGSLTRPEETAQLDQESGDRLDGADEATVEVLAEETTEIEIGAESEPLTSASERAPSEQSEPDEHQDEEETPRPVISPAAALLGATHDDLDEVGASLDEQESPDERDDAAREAIQTEASLDRGALQDLAESPGGDQVEDGPPETPRAAESRATPSADSDGESSAPLPKSTAAASAERSTGVQPKTSGEPLSPAAPAPIEEPEVEVRAPGRGAVAVAAALILALAAALWWFLSARADLVPGEATPVATESPSATSSTARNSLDDAGTGAQGQVESGVGPGEAPTSSDEIVDATLSEDAQDRLAEARAAARSVPLTDPSRWNLTEDDPAPSGSEREGSTTGENSSAQNQPEATDAAASRAASRRDPPASGPATLAAERPSATDPVTRSSRSAPARSVQPTETASPSARRGGEAEQPSPARAIEQVREAFASARLPAIDEAMRQLRAVVTEADPDPQRAASVRDLEQVAELIEQWGVDPRAELDGPVAERLRQAALLVRVAPELARRSGVVARTRSLVERRFAAALEEGEDEELDRILTAASRFGPLESTVNALAAERAEHLADRSRERLEDRLELALRRSTPHRVLDEIDALPPARTAGLEDLIEQVRERLVTLDSQRPELDIDSLSEVEFESDEDLTLRLRAQDDYEVVEVELFVRGQGSDASSFVPVPVRFVGGRVFAANIPRSLHQGRAILIYGVARDRSGNEGLLGSQRSPVRLKPR